jgi:hypothetical protein
MHLFIRAEVNRYVKKYVAGYRRVLSPKMDVDVVLIDVADRQ